MVNHDVPQPAVGWERPGCIVKIKINTEATIFFHKIRNCQMSMCFNPLWNEDNLRLLAMVWFLYSRDTVTLGIWDMLFYLCKIFLKKMSRQCTSAWAATATCRFWLASPPSFIQDPWGPHDPPSQSSPWPSLTWWRPASTPCPPATTKPYCQPGAGWVDWLDLLICWFLW